MLSTNRYYAARAAHIASRAAAGYSTPFPLPRALPARDQLTGYVERYGFNSTSYVLLEGPKRYFTTPRIDGFIAYQMAAGVAVIGGDPVCAQTAAADLLAAFRRVMRGHPVCAYQVSPEYLPAFRANGFADAQVGSEAVFALSRFTLAGGDMELVRAATNKARRAGLVVSEHDPFAPDAETLNDELRAVSEEWLRDRREMGFLLGGLGLAEKSAKRYFVARAGGGAGRVEGFIVCEPIYGRNGYYLDVTRRRANAVRGTMELLTTEIFKQLHSEGYKMASMGLAPLARLDDPDLAEHPRLWRLMQFAYANIADSYDFQSLHRYKAKYHPHVWERRYLCFTHRLGPRALYALLRVRDAFAWRAAWHSSQTAGRSQTSWKQSASFAAGLVSALLLWP